jgi:hypothetical protein
MQAFYIMEYLLNAAFVLAVSFFLPSVIKSIFPGSPVSSKKRKSST